MQYLVFIDYNFQGISAWQHPVIVLKDVPYEDLQGIVEFIYHGEVSVDKECLTSFLKTAQMLRVKGMYLVSPIKLGKKLAHTKIHT